jgi:YegS/Rv2252/BmrU family lipid kinase
MTKTLFFVNLNAGRLRKTWKELEAQLPKWVSDYKVIITEAASDVDKNLIQAIDEGFERIVSVGGDGTNKYVVSAIMQYQEKNPDHSLVFAGIPAGTGRDFARAAGIPHETLPAAEYLLTQAIPQKVDVAYVQFADIRDYYLNVSNLGISYDVAHRAGKSSKRPWTFLVSIIASLAFYKPEAVSVELDGEKWYEGNVYITAIANSKSIAQGVLIAPDAKYDDGLFDVVIAEEMPTLELIRVFPTIYTGQHIHHPKVMVKRAKNVRITTPNHQPIGLDLDGEPFEGAAEINYTILPKAFTILL